MKPLRLFRFRSPVLALLTAVAAGLALTGCGSLLVPKHRVLVDAISAPGATKPSGKSYRLVAKRAMVSQPVQVPIVKACVDVALSGQGMFEAAAGAPPDLFVEVSYGRESAPRADAASRETFLQLSARSNPERLLDRPSGPELWDVKVAVLGVAGSIETAMPLLSSVAVNYLASDTRLETTVEIPDNSPMVEAVRTGALKQVTGRSAPVASAAPVAPVTPVTPGAAPATGASTGKSP